MGVYIPNMKMPDCCFNCHYDDCTHWVSNSFEKPTDCPLIEISETKYHNMVVALDILEHEQNDCIEAERRADGDIY